jgi:hypothetical protein
MVSAFAARQRLVRGQVKVAEKSNEIVAVPALLDMLDAGQVVGVGNGGATIWNGGIPTALDGQGSVAFGINNLGQVVGITTGGATVWNGRPCKKGKIRGYRQPAHCAFAVPHASDHSSPPRGQSYRGCRVRRYVTSDDDGPLSRTYY